MKIEGLKIVSLQAENVKRLRAVRVTPDGALVIISGENGAGKSSVLDCIEMALGGKGAIPDEPIHRGSRKARVRIVLGSNEVVELDVERTFSSSGSKLTVKDADGNAKKSPQKLLDDLVSSVSFDPLEFSMMEPKSQDRVLRDLVGLDFAKLDGERGTLYEARTTTNRETKRLEATLQGLPPKASDVPDEEVSVSELMAELKRREAAAAKADDLRAAVVATETSLSNRREDVTDKQYAIDELEKKLGEAREALVTLQEERDEAEQSLSDAQKAADAYTYPDPAQTLEQLTTVEETNRKVRANGERRAAREELDASEAKGRELTDAIEGIDEQKADELARAEYPIPGLGLDDGGVLLDGLPFDQACTSAKIRASVAIGAALNPKLRVLLVRRGNDLDRTRLAEVAQMAEELGVQIWLEKIDPSGVASVIIEDGEVVDPVEEA